MQKMIDFYKKFISFIQNRPNKKKN